MATSSFNIGDLNSDIAALNSKMIKKTTVAGTTDASGNITAGNVSERTIIGACPDRSVNAEVVSAFVSTYASGVTYMLHCVKGDGTVVANQNVGIVITYVDP